MGVAWFLVYAVVVAIAVVTVIVRPQPTLLRGRSLFLFTTAFVALAWLTLWWRAGFISRPQLFAGGAALVLTAALTPWWFILGGPRAGVVETIQMCFGRVCARYERDGTGFRMTVPGGDLHVRLHAPPTERLTLLSFRARPSHRKGELFLRLLSKQYPGVLPTIRFRLR